MRIEEQPGGDGGGGGGELSFSLSCARLTGESAERDERRQAGSGGQRNRRFLRSISLLLLLRGRSSEAGAMLKNQSS